ncbi:MAG TPA: hypothetical protein PLY93_12340, partial [Turneriella sp.]|nr:hypothetical protein [Turneriella sp.]
PSQKAANCSLPIVTYRLVGHKTHFSNLSGLGVYEIARGDGMNVRVKVQAVAGQMNCAQDSRFKRFVDVCGSALPFRVNSCGEKIQKPRVDSSRKK